MADEVCEGCKFWYDVFEAKGSDIGQCVRFPPIADRNRQHADIWPMTSMFAWCGEFQKKPVSGETSGA